MKLNWYNRWHNHPRHQHTHWLVFGLSIFIVTVLLFVGLLNLDRELNSIAQAQTPPTGGAPNCPLTLGDPAYCRLCNYLCAHGEGDCTGNSTCQPGLICNDTYGIGLQYGYTDPNIDICEDPTLVVSNIRIYYVFPYQVQNGGTILIAGENLADTVDIIDANGNTNSYTGNVNNNATEVTLPLPSLTPGFYSVQIRSGSNTSNKVSFEVIPGNFVQSITATSPPIISAIYPPTVTQGGIFQITGNYLTSNVQFFDPNGVLQGSTFGVVSTNLTEVTAIAPYTLPPGVYTVGITGPFGLAVAPGNLTITAGQVPIPPSAQSVPTATSTTTFQSLISGAFDYAIIIVGIAVFVMILYAGFLWLTSPANPGNIARAKSMIFNAIIGAVLLLSAYVILYTINPELVGGGFNLTGIPAPSSTGSASSQSLLAFSEPEAASAILAGCSISLDRPEFTSVDCSSIVASSLNLLPNPILSTQDVAANNQVDATILQSGGNLGAGIKVVILDTGYNYNHPELSSSYLGGWDFVNNDNDPMDDDMVSGSDLGQPPGFHGSHVAGIITADGIDPQAKGVAPQAGIIAGKVLDSQGNGSWDNIVDAIYWAIDGPDRIHGTSDDFNPDIINISIGSIRKGYQGYCDFLDQSTVKMAKAIQYAKDNGALVVVSSGNDAPFGVAFPGCIDASFTVGAVDSADRIANFSNKGQAIDIVGPGVSLYSAHLGSNYVKKGGTSQATPVVSGVAALLKSANPGFTVSQLENAITSTACDLGATGKDNIFGWGRVTAVPGSCTPAPPSQTQSVTGRLTLSPVSCTKGTIAGNNNCNINLSYTITGISSPTTLTVLKNNAVLQNIQCNSSPCNGQLTDQNPREGTHRYIVNLPNGTAIANANAYIRISGSLNSSFTSCTKQANPNNPNCDITLNVTAPGVAPNSVFITKDGFTWRIVQCFNAQCNQSAIDPNPTVGTHTYSLRDAAGSNLGRAVINIQLSPPTPPPPTPPPPTPPPPTPPPPTPPPPSTNVELCTGTNYTGTCEIFTSSDPWLGDVDNQNKFNLGIGNYIPNDSALSIKVPVGITIYVCQDVAYGFSGSPYTTTGICESFTADDPDLNNNVVGGSTISSIRFYNPLPANPSCGELVDIPQPNAGSCTINICPIGVCKDFGNTYDPCAPCYYNPYY